MLLQLENSERQGVLLSKVTQFLYRNNGLVTPVSNIDGNLPRDIRVSSIQLNRPFEQCEYFPHLKTLRYRQYAFQKVTQFS
jgi:hypothetical protein